jgi:hypothetical protein
MRIGMATAARPNKIVQFKNVIRRHLALGNSHGEEAAKKFFPPAWRFLRCFLVVCLVPSA